MKMNAVADRHMPARHLHHSDDRSGADLHHLIRMVNHSVWLAGGGGSNYTPINTPSEFMERELAAFVKNDYLQVLEC